MTNIHRCEDCKHDKDTPKANDKCHYCRNWCNYKSVNIGKFFRRVALFYIPMVIGFVIMFLRRV